METEEENPRHISQAWTVAIQPVRTLQSRVHKYSA